MYRNHIFYTKIALKSGAILSHQTSYRMFSGSWPIFRHPWDPWGPVNSRDISFLIFVFKFFVLQPPGEFFHYSQIEARCHLYWFDMHENDNLIFYSHNGWVFKVIQDVSAVIWMELEPITTVWLLMDTSIHRRRKFNLAHWKVSFFYWLNFRSFTAVVSTSFTAFLWPLKFTVICIYYTLPRIEKQP